MHSAVVCWERGLDRGTDRRLGLGGFRLCGLFRAAEQAQKSGSQEKQSSQDHGVMRTAPIASAIGFYSFPFSHDLLPRRGAASSQFRTRDTVVEPLKDAGVGY